MWSKVFNEDIERTEELKEKYGLTEFYELGRIQEKKIENIDKGIVYELKDVLACVIRDYLRLYNKENLKASCPTVYLKALYPDKILNEYWLEQRGTPEELDKWTEMIEETAKSFEKLLSDWAPECQEAVDVAFDSLKKIFLGLWT
jgi:hypothetical protein